MYRLALFKCKYTYSDIGFSLRGAGTGGLGLTIEGASEAKMSCKDNKDGSCSVEYVPFTPGDYDVNINYGGHPIPGSPFRVPVRDPVDPSKVKCSGPGLGKGVRAHIPQTFTVDCTQAGQAPLDVKLYGPSGEEVSRGKLRLPSTSKLAEQYIIISILFYFQVL